MKYLQISSGDGTLEMTELMSKETMLKPSTETGIPFLHVKLSRAI